MVGFGWRKFLRDVIFHALAHCCLRFAYALAHAGTFERMANPKLSES
jgi:hypothetical protein